MLTVALSLLLLATETTAATPQQPAAAMQPAETPKAEKKICKREQSTGSRMDSKRICLTAAQWKKRQDQSDEPFGAYK